MKETPLRVYPAVSNSGFSAFGLEGGEGARALWFRVKGIGFRLRSSGCSSGLGTQKPPEYPLIIRAVFLN